MKTLALVGVALVSALHFYILILEMFLWQKPIGLRTFRQSPENARASAKLALNQGLYNGFLAVGLALSFFFNDPQVALSFQAYFLACVIAAGILGGATANRRIFYVQGLPAILTLLLLWASQIRVTT